MEDLQYDYRLAETVEGGNRKVTSAPENWIIEGRKLLWPPTGMNQKRKKQVAPESDWNYYECKILGPPFKNLRDALAKEKTYEQFSNSESEKEHLKKKELKRKHPVVFDLIDVNKDFDQIKIQRVDGIAINENLNTGLTPMLPAEFDGNYLTNEDLSQIFDGIGNMMSNSNQGESFPASNLKYIQYQPEAEQLAPQSIQENNLINVPGALQSNIGETIHHTVHKILPPPSAREVHDSFINQLNIPQSSSYYNNSQRDDPQKGGTGTMSMHQGLSSQPGMRTYQASNVYVSNTSSSNPINRVNSLSGKSMNVQDPRIITVISDKRIGTNEFSRPKTNKEGSTVQKKIGKENRQFKRSVEAGKKKSKKKQDRPMKLLNEARSTDQTIRESLKSSELVNTDALLSSDHHKLNPTSVQTLPNNLEINYLPLIYKELLELKTLYMADRAVHMDRLDKIESKLEGKSPNSIDLFADGSRESFDLTFPVTKNGNLRDLEVNLFTEPLYKAKMNFRLKSIGGKKPHLMIRACMKYLIHDSLLKRFTWKGTRKKKAFIKYKNIWTIVRSCVQERFQKYTDAKFNKYMGEYIKFAKTRNEREEEAKKKKEAENDETNSEKSVDEETDGETDSETGSDNKSEDSEESDDEED